MMMLEVVVVVLVIVQVKLAAFAKSVVKWCPEVWVLVVVVAVVELSRVVGGVIGERTVAEAMPLWWWGRTCCLAMVVVVRGRMGVVGLYSEV
jgi:hypothetical protein